MPRRSQLAILLVPLAILPGCLDPGVRDDDVSRMRAAIERDVPDAEVLDVTVRDPLNACCGAEVTVATDAADPAAARKLTRAVARAAGLNAPPDTVTVVSNFVGGRGCAPQGRNCWRDGMSVSTAEAAWLWGDPPGPPPAAAQQKGQACTSGPDLTLPGVYLSDPLGFSPRPAFRVTFEQAVPPDQVQAALDRVAGFVWSCYPGAIETLTVTADQQGNVDPQGTAAPVSFAAAELRQRFGGRPDDLPQ